MVRHTVREAYSTSHGEFSTYMKNIGGDSAELLGGYISLSPLDLHSLERVDCFLVIGRINVQLKKIVFRKVYSR